MNKNKVFWKTKSGQLIDVDKMDINHLRNTLKMIIRNSQKSQVVSKPKSSFRLNGEMAQAFVDDQELMDDYKEIEIPSDLGYLFNDDEARGNQW
jgi:hypothetical protein